MRLQTDPTVIYGMGASYDGNIRRRDLETDTPYNTYTRAGLPPTPIAMPGAPALRGGAASGAGRRAVFRRPRRRQPRVFTDAWTRTTARSANTSCARNAHDAAS